MCYSRHLPPGLHDLISGGSVLDVYWASLGPIPESWVLSFKDANGKHNLGMVFSKSSFSHTRSPDSNIQRKKKKEEHQEIIHKILTTPPSLRPTNPTPPPHPPKKSPSFPPNPHLPRPTPFLHILGPDLNPLGLPSLRPRRLAAILANTIRLESRTPSLRNMGPLRRLLRHERVRQRHVPPRWTQEKRRKRMRGICGREG